MSWRKSIIDTRPATAAVSHIVATTDVIPAKAGIQCLCAARYTS